MQKEDRITEQTSEHDNLEKKSIRELLIGMNEEDKKVPLAIEQCIPQIEEFVKEALLRMKNGGRLFYIGAGTSGRLGIVDASECPPTFGVPHGLVIGIIAGGDTAIRKAVEFAEDDAEQGWIDLQKHDISEKDILVGIAASGSTPYVIGALKHANSNGLLTACITSNKNSLLAAAAQYAITPIVGPEFVTGSTRMKSGTAQKLVLNMISTSLMIGLGHVKGNKMVDMQLSNNKLVDRGTKMLMYELEVDYDTANNLLIEHGSVRKAIISWQKKK
jgi:N-acetylmuramic acid 6-phosphate etherase